MKKQTKTELIEKGKTLGLNLTMKMTAAEMAESIATAVINLPTAPAEKEVLPEKPKELVIGELAATVNRISDCGCSYVLPKTIVKLIDDDKGPHKPLHVRFCNSGCTVWVYRHDVRPLTEEEAAYAAVRFSNATGYRYATVD